MSKLFENELKIANEEGLFYSDDDQAGNAKGNPATYFCMNTKFCVCFRV